MRTVLPDLVHVTGVACKLSEGTGREPWACSSGSELLGASSVIDGCISSVGMEMSGSNFGGDDSLVFTRCLRFLLYFFAL